MEYLKWYINTDHSKESKQTWHIQGDTVREGGNDIFIYPMLSLLNSIQWKCYLHFICPKCLYVWCEINRLEVFEL